MSVRTLVFNGWAAGSETWSLCSFSRDWTFSYLEELDGLPERVLGELGPCVLVGFSMGGCRALETLLRCPDRVRGLVLVSATPRMTEDPATDWRGMSERRVKALMLGTRLVYRNDPSPLFAPDNLERGLDYLRHTDLRAALRASSALQSPDFRRVPVRILQSARDGIVRPENAAWLGELFPQAEVTIVPGGEHVLPVTAADRIAAAVREVVAAAVRG